MKTFKEYLIESSEVDEGRAPPPSMNYSFDEIDPNVDAQSFSRGRRERMQKNAAQANDEENVHRSERKAEYHAGNRGQEYRNSDQGQAWDGSYEDETEAKLPATVDKLQMALGRAKETTREMQPSAKRWEQRQTRRRRQTTGK